MGIGSRLDTLLYGVSLRTTISTKNRYFRRPMEQANRELARRVTNGWDREIRRQEYLETVVPYWKKFGRRPKRFWFELAGSRDQKMDPRFIPSDLYYIELAPYINNLPFHWALEDKNYLDRRFPEVKQAQTVCRRIAGEFYDENMKNIREEDALKLCREHGGELFVKPSVYSCFGNGIKHFDPSECTDSQIRGFFAATGANLIVQEKILQHASLASLNPDAVNTLRVLSLFVEGKVHIPLMYLRVGAEDTSHVTVGAEWNAEILPDGHVCSRVWHDAGYWISAREEGLFDDSFLIPGVGLVCEKVRALHPQVGHLKWIGWDFTLDQDGDPLLIELNTVPGDHAQRVCGRPLFGEMTDWVLEDFFHKRSMEGFQARGSWTVNKDIRKYRE